MRNLPKISIVIPSFNKVKYIGKTLQSIIDQHYPNLEVIIHDGGSTDGTLEIIKKFVSQHPDFSCESRKDKSQTEAINRGFKRTTGKILAFINADDVYKKGAFLKVGEYFTKHPKTLWLAGKGETIDRSGKKIARAVDAYKNHLLKLNNFSFLLAVNYLMQPSVFLSKRAFEKYGPFKGVGRSVMEYDLWLRLGSVEMPKVLNKYLSSFRLIESSISAKEFRKTLMEDEQIAEKYTDNPVILALHYLHNVGRVLIVKYLGIQ
jgi:glycosyltransferase involved in cell wall biosynthesis